MFTSGLLLVFTIAFHPSHVHLFGNTGDCSPSVCCIDEVSLWESVATFPCQLPASDRSLPESDEQKTFEETVAKLRRSAFSPLDDKILKNSRVSSDIVIRQLRAGSAPEDLSMNVLLGEMLSQRQLNDDEKMRLCEVLGSTFRLCCDTEGAITFPKAYAVTERAASVLKAICPLSKECWRVLIRALRDSQHTCNGRWLAILLLHEMPKDVLLEEMDLLLDIITKPIDDHKSNPISEATIRARDRLFYSEIWFVSADHEKAFLDDLTDHDKGLIEFANTCCNHALPETIEAAVQMMVVKAGHNGLQRVRQRMDSLTHAEDRVLLRLLECIALIDPESPIVKERLFRTIEDPHFQDWIELPIVIRHLSLSDAEAERIEELWTTSVQKSYAHALEDIASCRMLFCLGKEKEAAALFRRGLPGELARESAYESYLSFLRDVSYRPSRYRPLLMELMNDKQRREHQFLGLALLSRFTDLPLTNSQDIDEAIGDKKSDSLFKSLLLNITSGKNNGSKVHQ